MKILKLPKNNYYLKSSTKNTYIFCAGNSIIAKNILSNKIYVKEIDEKYKIKHNDNIFYKDEVSHEEIASCDTIIIADIEHQANPTSNLIKLSQIANDDTKIIVLSKNMISMMLLIQLKLVGIYIMLEKYLVIHLQLMCLHHHTRLI